MHRTVLIIDESFTCRWQLSQLVHQIEPEAKIHSAVNGLDAMELIYNLLPDILITSISLHKMNGVTLLKKIFQKSPVQPPPHVVIMHEFNQKHIQNIIPEMPLSGFLDKPPILDNLKRIWPSGEVYD